MTSDRTRKTVEWPTLMLLVLCYGVWLAAVSLVPDVSLLLAIVSCAVAMTLHSSLQHETLHGPTLINRPVSEWLVALPIGVFIPYRRFRQTHLEHHRDSRLTDPYDDPESNFLDPARWQELGLGMKVLLSVNNTLLGRMIFGPAVGQTYFVAGDVRAVARGDMAVARAWGLHLLGLLVLVALLSRIGTMPVWAYLVAAYLALSILKIRTFLEHRAHEHAAGRTVVIEDRGILALLFLNNNFHAVHHAHPAMPWYQLPGRYRDAKSQFLARNDGYVFRSYRDVFRAYLLRRKDPVAHPLWRQR